MDGITLARIITEELEKQGISKGEFYAQAGITATAFYGWKNGAMPKKETLANIEKCLGIKLLDYEKSDPREGLRDDLRILLHSASELPPSSVYALISQIEKLKEDST